MSKDEPLLVLSTFGNLEEAQRIGRLLVEERLAACVNLLLAVESIYRWDGAVETAAEVMALFKTTRGTLSELESRLIELHTYEVAEFIVLPLAGGSPRYLDWVRANTAYQSS